MTSTQPEPSGSNAQHGDQADNGTEPTGDAEAKATEPPGSTTDRTASADPSEASSPPFLPEHADRWTLLRDVAVFQGKLVLDGLRDLVLSPLSIAAALIGLATGGERPGRQFYDLLYVGRRSEGWINLFGAASHVTPPDFDREDAESVDALVDRLEEVARRRYEKGGMTQSAKDALDKALDSVNRNFRTGGGSKE